MAIIAQHTINISYLFYIRYLFDAHQGNFLRSYFQCYYYLCFNNICCSVFLGLNCQSLIITTSLNQSLSVSDFSNSASIDSPYCTFT